MEEGLLGGPVSPLEPTRTPQPHNLTFAEGGAKRLETPSTTDHVEVPQPQVPASANGEAHQLLGPVLAESAIVEDGKSTRTCLTALTLSALTQSVRTTSTRQAEEE